MKDVNGFHGEKEWSDAVKQTVIGGIAVALDAAPKNAKGFVDFTTIEPDSDQHKAMVKLFRDFVRRDGENLKEKTKNLLIGFIFATRVREVAEVDVQQLNADKLYDRIYLQAVAKLVELFTTTVRAWHVRGAPDQEGIEHLNSEEERIALSVEYEVTIIKNALLFWVEDKDYMRALGCTHRAFS